MIPGFNHNIQHLGKTYHIQTEDSGKDNPHIITLLYLEGTIIAKKKTSYADILTVDRLTDVVRELMQEQHKSMLRQLVKGGFDNLTSPIEVNGAPIQPETIKQMPPPKPAPPQAQPAIAAPTPIDASEINSLFGSSDSGEKSLDEIILSYLTEEGK